MPDRRMKDTELLQAIELKKSESFKRFWESNDVARLAYARWLLVSRKTRNEFADLNNANVFGDAHLIQNALFFNAGAASDDKAVKAMAGFCGLPMLNRSWK